MKPMSIVVMRLLSVTLITALVYGPFAIPTSYADEAITATSTAPIEGSAIEDRTSIDERISERGADNNAPVINPHEDVTVDAVSDSGAFVSYELPATEDGVDGTGVASCTPPSGSEFSIGTTTVTCTVSDSAGNLAEPVTFNVIVQRIQIPANEEIATTTASTTPSRSEGDPAVSTTTPDTGTGDGQSATTTPEVPDNSGGRMPDEQTATSTPTTTTDTNPNASSTSSANSADVPDEESDTDNTNFENITNGPGIPGPDDPRPIIDASATTTESGATEPLVLAIATSTDGTGSKIGGTVFTGNAVASTTIKNVLNITRSNVDGPGISNSSIIKSEADNEGDLMTSDETIAYSGDNRGEGGEGLATIRTGRAVSTAEVINVVNTNFFNSKGLILFLNPMQGDGLDLRDVDLSYFSGGGPGASPTQFGCTILTCLNSAALSVLNKNVATVDNDVYVRAATGANAATSTKTGGVNIETGNAYASANVLNLVNTNFINSDYLVLSFSNFGDLNDDIVLPDSDFFDELLENGNSLPELNSSSYVVNNKNDENFTGTTTTYAITGENLATTTGEGHGEIFTGAAKTSANSYTAANQTRVGGASVALIFRVSGNWSGTVKGLPDGLTWQRTEYGIEITSTGNGALPGTSQGVYNSSAFIASSTNEATLRTNVDVWAETGKNIAVTEHATGTIKTGDAYSSANVVNMVNTNIIGRKWIFASFNIFGDWSGDIDFGGHSPNLKVDAAAETQTSIAPSSEVSYRFTVANNGAADSSNVILAATYDKNMLIYVRGNTPSTETTTGTKWNLGTLAPGESKIVTATTRVLARGLPAGVSISVPLTATVSGVERDQNDGDNTSRAFITVTAQGASTGDTDTNPRDDDRGRTDTGNGGGGAPPPGGGGSPPPSGGGSPPGGGGSPPGGGGSPPGGGGSPPSGGGNLPGGGGAPPQNEGGSGKPSNPNPGGQGLAALGGGGGGGGGGVANGRPGERTVDPNVTISKTASVSTSTAPANIDYKVVVRNDKQSGPAYTGLLSDTLYDSKGAVMYNRAWNLDTIEPGDEITLTYTVAFGTTTLPGKYKNVAKVTAYINYSKLPYANPMIPAEATDIVEFESNGQVLGAATSTIPTITGENISKTGSCAPLLNSPLRSGSPNKAEVIKLQTFLNAQGFTLPATGFFGPLTVSAAKAFQRKYASEILVPVGLSSPTGLVYSSTIRKINSLACGGVEPTSATTPVSSAAPSAKAPIAPAKAKTPAKPKSKTTEATTKVDNSALLNRLGGWLSKFR